MKDYIYYIMIENRLQSDMIFRTEAELTEYAEQNNIVDYDILEWDVD